MSAELLREAARTMRGRAKVGDALWYPLPWGVEEADMDVYGIASRVTCEAGKGDVTDPLDEEVAEYIAGMHPGVALAVADLLDAAADTQEEYGHDPSDMEHPYAVARVFLGRDT